MRLTRLAMDNFGPYRHEVVDFSEFESSDLFLISGKTGAGKTTIFDALVYALYGTTTGGERTGAEMRATFATHTEPTKVQLAFSHGGRDYVLTRWPDQVLAKKRGSGLTTVRNKPTLDILEDGREIDELTGVKPVGARINSLLQLDANQFRQIILLPQGKFRQFLDADSDAKADLLRHLFDTAFYGDWQDALKKLANKRNAATDAAKARLETLSSQFDYGELAPAATATIADKLDLMTQRLGEQQAEVDGLNAAATAAQTRYETANAALQDGTALAAAWSRRQAAQARLAELEAAAPALAAKAARLQDLQWAHELKPRVDQRARLKQQAADLTAQLQAKRTKLAQATQSLAEAQAAQVAQAAQAPGITNLREQLVRLATTRSQLEQQAHAARAKRAAEGEYQQALAAQTTLQQAQATTQAELAQVQAALAANAEADQGPALAAMQTLSAALAATAKSWQQARTRLAAAAAQQTAAASAAAAAKQHADEATAAYNQLHDANLNNQIAALVAQLTPGAPCPVCGSTTHPAPAAADGGVAVAPAALKRADAKRSEAQAALAQAEAQVATLSAQQAQLTQDVAAYAAQIQTQAASAAAADAQATLDALQQHLTALQQQQDALVAERQALQAQQATLSAQAEAQTQAFNQQAAAVHAANAALVAATTQLKDATEALPEEAPDLARLTQQTQTLQKQVQDFEAASKKADAAAHQAGLTHKALETSVDDLEAQETQVAAQHQQATQAVAEALAARGETTEAALAALIEADGERAGLQQALTAAHTAQAEQAALLAAAVAQIAGRAAPALDVLTQARTEAQTQANAATAAQAAAQHALDAASALVATVRREFAANQKALKDGLALQRLATVVNGNNSQKLSLERYVLRTYLQQVLVVANARLEGLSDGRYQLAMHDEAATSMNHSGLELDVYDDQVGEVRSVHTLSGGESFIAALALALAMGEVIQQNAGGISVDALFIDEGFGSLDAASLDTALEALESIEGQSRLIGIISHVESLQTGIADQLRVVPTGAGDSHISVVHLGE